MKLEYFVDDLEQLWMSTNEQFTFTDLSDSEQPVTRKLTEMWPFRKLANCDIRITPKRREWAEIYAEDKLTERKSQ